MRSRERSNIQPMATKEMKALNRRLTKSAGAWPRLHASNSPMRRTAFPVFFFVAIGIFLPAAAPRGAAQAQREQESVKPKATAARSDPTPLEPIVYTITVPAPNAHCAEVAMTIPTGRHDTVELMM